MSQIFTIKSPRKKDGLEEVVDLFNTSTVEFTEH